MKRSFTLEYWMDENYYVGRLKEVPGIFSQGISLQELEENIEEAYQLMIEDDNTLPYPVKTKEILIKI